MKKIFLLLCVVSILQNTFAHSFSVTNSDGIPIYYDITSSASNTVSVTRNANNFNSYSGNVVIPSTVTYNNKTYTVTSISISAFCLSSGLTSVTIPSSVLSIAENAFALCSNLTTISIPASVTSIGVRVFDDCPKLSSINVDANSTSFCSVDGIIFNKTMTSLVRYPMAISGSYAIPSSVTSIGSQAFKGCTKLTAVTIPDGVTSIGEDAFSDCKGLSSIIIPSHITEIKYGSFSGCTGITTTIEIPSSVLTIGESAFSATKISSITIPSSVVSIGKFAFANTNIASLTIPASVTSIEEQAFFGCMNLITVTIPASVTKINTLVFARCTALKSINVPTTATYIGSDTFNGCTSLTSIKFPASITTIDVGAFYDCTGLTSIYAYNVTPIVLTPLVFFNVQTSSCVLHVPIGTKAAYQVADQWKDFVNIVDDIPTESLSLSANTLEFNNIAESKTVDIVSNTTWTATSSEAWLSISPNTATTGNATLTISATANTSNTARTATITVSANGVASQTIVVTQAAGSGTAALEIDNDEIIVYPNPTNAGFSIKTTEKANIQVFSNKGELLISRNVVNDEQISINNLTKGFYIVKIIEGDKVTTKTLVVE